jgi:hypothetical protein
MPYSNLETGPYRSCFLGYWNFYWEISLFVSRKTSCELLGNLESQLKKFSFCGCTNLLELSPTESFAKTHKVMQCNLWRGRGMFARLCNSRVLHSCLLFANTIFRVELNRMLSLQSYFSLNLHLAKFYMKNIFF